MTNKLPTFAQQVLQFTQSLKPDWSLPPNIELLFPYSAQETLDTMKTFYDKYYKDQAERIFIFGINPGRFGAGITGVPIYRPNPTRGSL